VVWCGCLRDRDGGRRLLLTSTSILCEIFALSGPYLVYVNFACRIAEELSR